MTYTHLTTDELVLIESYYHQNIPVTTISTHLKRSRTPIYNVIHFLKEGHTALDYYQQYKKNKKRCGRRKKVLPLEQEAYIKEKVAQGWTLDVIVGRKEKTGWSSRTPRKTGFQAEYR
ncbi:transposase [Carnobacterium inhibens subsp. gilichinskyi]|uniref:Transposase n=1 Tax=Carnobacterium inhibens subsp. gilichinskyi TaxID=1266845 RepID=U5SA56_9LACT|nr:transposase [Carnobacterium inhibens subsp. gilichinskyi]